MESVSHETEPGISLFLHLPDKGSDAFLIVHEQDVRVGCIFFCIHREINEYDRITEIGSHPAVIPIQEFGTDDAGCSRRSDAVRHAQRCNISRQQTVDRHAVADKRHFVADQVKHGRTEMRIVKPSCRKKSDFSRSLRGWGGCFVIGISCRIYGQIH